MEFVSPYRLHLFGDGGYFLDFGSELVSLPVHHLLQFQHHLSLLPLDTVCSHTEKWGCKQHALEHDLEFSTYVLMSQIYVCKIMPPSKVLLTIFFS